MATFLDEAKVPVRIACHTLNGNPWIVTLWFVARDGEFYCATSADAEVVKFVRSDSAVRSTCSPTTRRTEACAATATRR